MVRGGGTKVTGIMSKQTPGQKNSFKDRRGKTQSRVSEAEFS